MGSQKPRILVVEKDRFSRDSVLRVLENSGFEAHESSCKETAVEILKNAPKPYAMLVCDVLGEGLGLLDLMKSDSSLRHIPVVMTSGNDNLESVIKCVTSGAFDYIVKPLDIGMAERLLQVCLRNSRTGAIPSEWALTALGKIGEGAHGRVYLTKRQDGKLFAVKQVPMFLSDTADMEAACSEVHFLRILTHPNMIRCYQGFVQNNVLNIVMEYAECGNLRAQVEKRRSYRYFTELEIMVWFAQLVDAVRHMHNHGVLHRDIKTQNILLTKYGTIKLCDLGVSIALGESLDHTRTTCGTPQYMSPEVRSTYLFPPSHCPPQTTVQWGHIPTSSPSPSGHPVCLLIAHLVTFCLLGAPAPSIRKEERHMELRMCAVRADHAVPTVPR